MRELADVLAVVDALGEDASSAVLATLVRARGSTYRRPGARMVLAESMPSVGAISGGCLERDVERRAWYLTEKGPSVVTYDSRAGSNADGDGDADAEDATDEDLRAGFGLGCEGAVDVLLERLGPGAASSALSFAGACRKGKRRGVIVSVFAGPLLGARLFVDADGTVSGVGWGDREPGLKDHLANCARAALESGKSRAIVHDEHEAFVEVVEPAVPLVVCGAGYDAAPLVDLGVKLGWDVTVVASRSSELVRGRFVGATHVVASSPEGLGSRVPLDTRTAVVIMSHNYARDLAMLREMLASPAGYIGMLGPRRRTDRMLGDLRVAGRAPTESQCARLHGPIGLDVGAEGPEEVALAIVAEVLAVMSDRDGRQLRDRVGPIHS